MKSRISKESILSGVVAGLIWGSWAYYVQHKYGFVVAGKAALTQGIGSAFLGSALTITMDLIYKIESWPLAVKVPASVMLPMILATIALATVHYISGTPDIIKTMLPSQPVGYAWTLIYTLKLYNIIYKPKRNEAQSSECD
jgi:uncharacterized membrane protein (UPF0136 family)